jgi:alkyl sulfatase BDS1-like metallo-beta-lactamase superfamily hydrolase
MTIKMTMNLVGTLLIAMTSIAFASTEPFKPLEPSANQKLVDFQQKNFTRAQLIKMGERVRMSIGYSYANFTFIEGDDGVIVVDTGLFTNRAKHALSDYQKLVDKPIVAIIYTHTHNDHRGGSPVFVKAANKDIPIYGPSGWQERLDYDKSDQMELIKNRGLSQFGILLPAGNAGTVGAGIGPITRMDGYSGYELPNHTVPKEGMDLTISGVKMQFIPTPGDIESHMMVWLPDDKVMIAGDTLGGTLPYLSTARFEADRDARKMAASLDLIMEYPAEYVISGHGRPLIGKDDIKDVIIATRDLTLFLADQITRYSRKGHSPDAIIDILKLPSHLAEHPDLQPHYHKLDWLIRGMYLKKGGWGKNTLALVRHTDSEEAKRMVKLLGGIESVVEYAINAFNEADYPWAVQLATQALYVQPKHEMATNIKIEALRGIAYATESANERNYTLTKVAEMTGMLPWGKVYSKVAYITRVKQTSTELLELLKTRFKAEDALELAMTIGITVNEKNKTSEHTIELHKGILLYKHQALITEDAHITINRELLVALSTGAISWLDALNQEKIIIKNGQSSVERFVKLIDSLD